MVSEPGAVPHPRSPVPRPWLGWWLSAWARATLAPAARRAAAVWVGAAILGAVIFGPTGMQPADLTSLALHAPVAGTVLGLIWLLVYLPIARVIVRAEAASYLRSLPGPVLAPRLLGVGALLGLQLPWLALWAIGDGLRGVCLVIGETCVIAALARWRPPSLTGRTPVWTGPGRALLGVHLRALRRRAGDALLRGTGIAILAGATAGLFVRNNQVTGAGAAVLGASVIAVVLVPAQVGALLVLLDSHRASGWLAHSLGISRGARTAALAVVITIVQLAATALALGATAAVSGPDVATLGLLAVTSLAVAIGAALGATRVLLGAEASLTIAARTVSGAVMVAAIAVIWLGLLGVPGALAILATGALALATVPA